MAKISIVMPSFNVAQYITECIESVVGQTHTDLEIILVDAGSSDGTLEIIEKYAFNDDRIRVINSDKKSYGYQVNLGIEVATGQYVGIIETDDVIEPDMYEHLLGLILRYDCDYVKGNAENFCSNSTIGRITDPIVVFKPDEYIDGIVSIEPQSNPQLLMIDRFLWNGLYKSEFIKKIKLNETPGAAFQDIGFLIQCFMKAKHAVYSDKIVHHYRQDNVAASGFSPKCFSYLTWEYSYIDKFIDETDTDFRKYMIAKLIYQIKGRYTQMAAVGVDWEQVSSNMEELTDMISQARENGLLSEEIMGGALWAFMEDYLAGAKDLFDEYRQDYLDDENNVRTILYKMRSTQTIIWGAGNYGKNLLKVVIANGISNCVGVCDNNQQLWGSLVLGHIISQPEVIINNNPDAVIVIANKKYGNEIRKELHDMGVVDNSIMDYTAKPNRRFYYVCNHQ